MEHQGQFALLRHRVQAPGFQYLDLPDGWALSYDKKLPVFFCPRNGILLIGYAWQSRPDLGSPEEEIEKLAPDPTLQQLFAMEESWCGRYVLIGAGTVLQDASSLFCVFYASNGVSSDCTLLARELGLPEVRYQCGEVMNWMPCPLTHYPGIKRLLASQCYLLGPGEVCGKPLLASDFPCEDTQLVERFTELFCHSLNNLAAQFPERRLLIALTGGYDSRTLFALAKKAGLDFNAFTLEHDAMLEGDASIPRILCEKTKTPFVYIERDRDNYSAELEDAYQRHMAGMVRDEDRLFYAYGQYQTLMAPYGDVLFLRSSVWENVIEYFRRLFDEQGPNDEFYSFFELEDGSLEKRSMEEYFAWCAAHPQPGVCPSDRFLWEQREGCWLSYIEQGFDVIDHALTLQPVNCRLLLSLLMRFPREERLGKQHQDRIIASACPAIREVPYATEKLLEDTTLHYLKTKLAKAVRRLKRMGLKRTVRTYISIFTYRKEQKQMEKKSTERGKR